MSTPALEVVGLRVRVGGSEVLGGVDLRLAGGEVVALLGPSGSGKTTLLGAIAGFVAPVAGEVRLAGETVSGPGVMVPPERRRIGLVFQSHALWPHLSARDTVAFPGRAAGAPRAAARRRADELLAALGLQGLGDRRPAQLSGGQQQRVGVARALARAADLYLLDEPTAHLDPDARQTVVAEIYRRCRERGAAVLLATHEAAEAFAAADRVVVLRVGTVAQVGTPAAIYEQPVDEWVARLGGPGSIIEAGAGALGAVPGGAGRFLLRPEWVSLGGPAAGTVVAVEYRGPDTELLLDTPAGAVRARHPGPPRHRVGDAMGWQVGRAWRLG